MVRATSGGRVMTSESAGSIICSSVLSRRYADALLCLSPTSNDDASVGIIPRTTERPTDGDNLQCGRVWELHADKSLKLSFDYSGCRHGTSSPCNELRSQTDAALSALAAILRLWLMLKCCTVLIALN